MRKKKDPLSINAKENWGGLVDPDDHVAAFGARFADSRSREFGVFGDRMTLIGEEAVAHRLERLILSKNVIKDIKKNTRFSYYGGDKPPYDDANSWSATYKMGKDFEVSLDVRCAGEYVYVRAYADLIPEGRLGVEPAVDGHGNGCWRAVMQGYQGGAITGPLIYADGAAEAMSKLVEFVANELEAKGCLE